MSAIAVPQTADLLTEARVHCVRWGGRGPRVLLLHPIGFDHRTWEPMAPFLEADCRLAAVDLPGHGESDKPPTADYGLLSLGRRMVGLLDELGWDDAVFVGNSLGGGTSLAAAIQAPARVRALVLLNSVGFRSGLPPVGRLAFVPLLPHAGRFAPVISVQLGLSFAQGRWGSFTGERSLYCSRHLRTLEGREAFFRTLRQLYGPDLDRMAARYGEIRCPTLVLHGERDPLIRLSHAERLAREVPGAEMERLVRCGHFPQEENPELVASRLRAFLSRVDDTSLRSFGE
jgi:pimeloyl-ACP methyl ester carboxylesterase